MSAGAALNGFRRVIAREAGISQPYLFRLFRTKKELYLATSTRRMEETYQAFERASRGLSGVEALEAMGAVYTELIEDRTRLLLMLQCFAECDDADIRTYENAPEACDDKDNDCDSIIDETTEKLGLGTRAVHSAQEIADHIAVMYAGRIVETGTLDEIFYDPQHPYTWGLLGSMPRFDKPPTDRLMPIKGTPPSLIRVPSGCAFHPRCAFAQDRCKTDEPPLYKLPGNRRSACHYWEEVVKS